MFQKILVSYDGSEQSKVALDMAIELAAKHQGDLDIVHVPEVETPSVAMGHPVVDVPAREEEIRLRAEIVLEEAKSLVRQHGFDRASAETLTGTPAEAILARAKETAADLIVAGRRGHGTLVGLIIGSVSQKLVSHAECPVLTVQKSAS